MDAKLKVSLAEYRLFCRALVQKRPMILGSLLEDCGCDVAWYTHIHIYLCIYIDSVYIYMCIYICSVYIYV